MEKLQFTSSSTSRVTKSLERAVVELRREMSIKAVSQHLGLHWETVKNIEKKYLQRKFRNIKLKNVKAIGIDEVYMGKQSGVVEAKLL
jgi:transposase